jgi:hypothetical protein
MFRQQVIERFSPKDGSRDASRFGELVQQLELLVINIDGFRLAFGLSHG